MNSEIKIQISNDLTTLLLYFVLFREICRYFLVVLRMLV